VLNALTFVLIVAKTRLCDFNGNLFDIKIRNFESICFIFKLLLFLDDCGDFSDEKDSLCNRYQKRLAFKIFVLC
jgi:hypothetical protein